MAEQSGLLEEKSVIFTNSKVGECRSRSSLGRASAASRKSPQVDGLLENTLFGNHIEVTKLLTKREMEILRLIVSGKTNKRIAQIFHRSQRTVEYHRNRLMRKLEAHSVADLVKRAITMGIT